MSYHEPHHLAPPDRGTRIPGHGLQSAWRWLARSKRPSRPAGASGEYRGSADPPAAKAHHTSNNRGDRGGMAGRSLIITLVVSLGLHAAAVTAVLMFLRPGVPVANAPDKPTEVELVMVEHKGDVSPAPVRTPSRPAPPTSPPSPPAAKPQTNQQTPSETEVASPPAPPPVEAQPDTPVQTSVPATASDPAPAKPAETPVQQVRPAPEPVPAAQPAPTISLAGTDSPSDARAFGDRIIPAAPDAVFHNRPPEYPMEAAREGEQGTVVLVIHVSPAGTAAGVDLVRSSGYALLDRAAQDAVSRWRFLPAIKDGQPVASDMTMGFEFDNE